MKSAISIMTAIRSRLADAGFLVLLGKVVDPSQDTLPLITVHYSGDGETTEIHMPERVSQLDIVVEYWARASTADPLMDLIPVGDSIRNLLTQHVDGIPDRLGGAADECLHIKTIIQTQMDHTDVGAVHSVFRVRY
jgi:hypothetical protein